MENEEYKEKAYRWYKEHKEHVDRLIGKEKFKINPSSEDIKHPELWKSIHWVWFFDNDSERTKK